jgi:hypothetical protein
VVNRGMWLKWTGTQVDPHSPTDKPQVRRGKAEGCGRCRGAHSEGFTYRIASEARLKVLGLSFIQVTIVQITSAPAGASVCLNIDRHPDPRAVSPSRRCENSVYDVAEPVDLSFPSLAARGRRDFHFPAFSESAEGTSTAFASFAVGATVRHLARVATRKR